MWLIILVCAPLALSGALVYLLGLAVAWAESQEPVEDPSPDPIPLPVRPPAGAGEPKEAA